MSPEPTERLEVWPGPDGMWRWRYRQAHRGIDLPSAEIYSTRMEARRAARWAYPGVDVVDLELVRGRSDTLSRTVFRLAAVVAAIAVVRRSWRLVRGWRRWIRRGGR